MIIDPLLIGKRIKEIRKKKKISQMALAEKCDISESHLSYIECGKNKPSLNLIIKIARELEISVDMLLEGYMNTDTNVYERELNELLNDCSPYEKRIIFETMHSLKKSLKQNKTLIVNEVKENINPL